MNNTLTPPKPPGIQQVWCSFFPDGEFDEDGTPRGRYKMHAKRGHAFSAAFLRKSWYTDHNDRIEGSIFYHDPKKGWQLIFHGPSTQLVCAACNELLAPDDSYLVTGKKEDAAVVIRVSHNKCKKDVKRVDALKQMAI